jgi:putative hydrolase
MNIIADTHCHTIASTHAYSTLSEVVHAASLAGLYAVAITDHGKTMPGAPGQWYFRNLQVLPRYLENVLVLRGIEANVVNYEGDIDLDLDDLCTLEWVVASMHDAAMPKEKGNASQCTEAWLRVAQNPHVHVIAHSGSEKFKYDYEKVIPEFGRQGKLVEINEGTFLVRKGSVSNCANIAKLCKKHGVPIIVNSDSHFHASVGKFSQALAMLREIDFPVELVVNSSVERFQKYLSEHTNVFTNKEV